MSLEAALDEERRDVLALLEGRKPASRAQSRAGARAVSPVGITPSPVRSMLDVGDDHSPVPPLGRHASIAGIGVGVTSPTSPTYPSQVRSMLDPNAVFPRPGNTSPPAVPARSISPAVNQPPRVNVEKEYNFEVLPTNDHGALPKRAAQGYKRSSMGGIFNSSDNNARSEATKAFLGKASGSKSKSPGGFFGRSSSPGNRKRLNTNSSSLMTGPNVFVSDSGQLIDMTNAYRRLSDAALWRSGGSLSGIPIRKGSDPAKGEMLAPDGGIRLTEDFPDEDAVETSDEDSHSSDDDWGTKRRGRGRRREGEEGDDELERHSGREAKSLLAAAEDERKNLIANSMIKSLLDPVVPGLDAVDGKPLTSSKKSTIHPHTSYDAATPSFITPHGSEDEEEMDDIRRAQSLQMLVSPIHSDSGRHRCIRQILRGHYKDMAEEAAQGLRRQRMYLVATDLSEEAAYALEWTIGTVLKDGDTLFAIYAADATESGDSTGNSSKLGQSSSSESSAIDIGEGAKAVDNTAELVKVLSNTEQSVILTQESSRTEPKRFNNVKDAVSQVAPRSRSRAPSLPVTKLRRLDFTGMSRAERERWKSTEGITERCIALLRKTKLQVRVVIDVFHCKSPRHMITEVIDYLEPTLVVLGSRGRSAIKGVLLGSFSNYLVTKSSVPVMVARKKLKKHSKSLKRPTLRFSNVLHTPDSNAKLATAKIDKVMTKSD